MEANWGDRCEVLYPPCNVDEFLNNDFNSKEKVVVSLGQYRPEKRHDLQLDMMKYHLKQHPESDIKFKILGSGKFEESELAFQRLQKRVKDEGIKNVELLKDLPFETLKNIIRRATFGVHTMIDEHFGYLHRRVAVRRSGDAGAQQCWTQRRYSGQRNPCSIRFVGQERHGFHGEVRPDADRVLRRCQQEKGLPGDDHQGTKITPPRTCPTKPSPPSLSTD
eukprot:GABU01004734.1.p1 GENE.GABU01004734.1~~GABU01004734.1.p1  ORF type:complete len:243 (+),score=40.76 GABU01004734.1:68-730(+)